MKTFAVAFGLILISSYQCAAEETRTWRDNSGAYEVKAALAKVDGDFVHLKREDGKTIKVPIRRLSEADRNYLSEVEKGANPFTVPTDDPPNAADAYVMVTVARKGHTDFIPGIVFHTQGKKSYIAIPGTRQQDSVYRRDPREDVITIHWNDGRGRRTAAAKLVTYSFGAYSAKVLAAPAKDLPRAFPPHNTADAKEQEPVTVVGFEFDKSAEPPSFSHITTTTKIKNVFRETSRKITKIELERQGSSPPPDCLVLNAQGQIVGFTNDEGKQKLRSYAAPAANLHLLLEPHMMLHTIGQHDKDKGRDHFRPLVFIIDPFERVDSVRMLVRRLPKEPDLSEPQPNADGNWPPLPDDATVVQLSRAALPQEVLDKIRHARLLWYATIWHGDYQTEPTDRIPIELQPVLYDKDGKPTYSRIKRFTFIAR